MHLRQDYLTTFVLDPMREALQIRRICALGRGILNISVDAGRIFHPQKHKYDSLSGRNPVNWFSFLDQKSSRQIPEDSSFWCMLLRVECFPSPSELGNYRFSGDLTAELTADLSLSLSPSHTHTQTYRDRSPPNPNCTKSQRAHIKYILSGLLRTR